MRTTLTTLIVLFVAIACVAQEARNAGQMFEAGFKRYQIESCVINYKYTGDVTGTSVVHFDSWGWRESTLAQKTLKAMGTTTQENTKTIVDGEFVINIDMNTLQGTKMNNPMIQRLASGDQRDITEAGMEMLKGMGGEMVGTETLLGKECEVWFVESMGTKSWLWKGVTLRIEAEMMGLKFVQEAIAIQDGASISDSDVAIPEGAQVKSMVNPMQGN